MDILIANLYLLTRSGTEIVVRDLALHLKKRGHGVVVFAPGGVGALGDEIRACGISVADNVEDIPAAPDLIHGHHSMPTLLAMAKFPKSPAIWMSHDFRNWFDEPPRLSNVYRYVPVDETRRKFLVDDRSIPSDKVETLYNAVDLTRFPPRAVPLREKPQSVLAFTKTTAQLEVIGRICGELNIQFNTLGRGAGREVANPEQELVDHEIIFATGRSAIEALCAGASVIVGDARGLGGIVTSGNYDYFRSFNFGSETFNRPFTRDEILRDIDMYDAGDARLVSNRMRQDADIDRLMDRLEVIYSEAVTRSAQFAGLTPSDIRELWEARESWLLPREWRHHRRTFERIMRRPYYSDRVRGILRYFRA